MTESMVGKYDVLFMEKARSLARMARDVGTPVGCVLVDITGKTIGEGCNVLMVPNGYRENCLPAGRNRRFIIHAEMTALLSARGAATTAYCTLAPCFDCLKHLCYLGIKNIIYDQCLGANKIFTQENSTIFTEFTAINGVTIQNLLGIPFLQDLVDRGYLCEK